MKLTILKKVVSAFMTILFCQSCSQGGAIDVESVEVQAHIDKALALAGDTFMGTTVSLQCKIGDVSAGQFLSSKVVPPPQKVFDNLYYVGLTSVAAWAIETSDGIILIDALNTSDDAQNVIEVGMRRLGLDPVNIKYIIVTHGHGDHYGGARYLVEKYGARVLMTESDWAMASNPPKLPEENGRPAPNWGKAPDKDMIATDGQVLTLGDTAIHVVTTPGHTPGTLSLVFPIFDHGKKQMASLWGGTGLPNKLADVRTYEASVEKFANINVEHGVAVPLSNHPFVDQSLVRMEALKKGTGETNPFVIGEVATQQYFGILSECAKAEIARLM